MSQISEVGFDAATKATPGMTPGAVTPVVEASDISKRFGSTVALRDAKICIHPGRTHALVGRNGAGKSTLVSILTGLREPDTGWVKFNGQDAPPPGNPKEWQKHVACVYQHSTIIPDLSVTENLFINRQMRRFGLIDWCMMRREARALLDRWGVDVGVDTRAGDLGVEERQLVEIAPSLSRGARFVILDEPTAQLNGKEITRLFKRIEELKQKGITFLFISHHLQEVYEICEDVTVFRDATHIVTSDVADLPKDALIEAMTGSSSGHALTDAASRQRRDDGAVVARYNNLGSDTFHDISFDVRAYEIVGPTGISSSGRTELAEAVVGLAPFSKGTLEVGGKPMTSGDVPRGLALQVGCVPKSRHKEGLVLGQTIEENVSMPIFNELGKLGFINPSRKSQKAKDAIQDLDIHAKGPQHIVGELSGGNQQKVVFGRALSNDPNLLVLIDPTAGVDVKSKTALLDKAEELRQRGKGILLSSSELEDLRICDRVHVLYHGKIVATFEAGWSEAEMVANIEGLNQ
ncbi:sugar ABC transporter ATP-binding protein [Ruegeria sp. HKCCD7255]|uniref:sugar ABC transporter ATP-binding protein n=1 Tax=Ruegeria sp. HKCCD7255 TaxID=2683004 RepID=UPI001C2C3F2B|nr:sugar ABC transporter ATP-binding protein [Ruegeria sp. HKCCD7255]